MRVTVLAAALLAAAGPAAAQVDLTEMTRSYSYFHRVGADLATHDAELLECLSKAGQTQTIRVLNRKKPPNPYDPNGVKPRKGEVLSDNAKSALDLWLTHFKEDRTMAVNTDNCMVVKGWEIVSVSDAVGKEIMKPDEPQLARAFLTDRVGAPAVSGGIVRSWGNDAAYPETRRYNGDPSVAGKGSISVKGLPTSDMRMAAQTPGPTKYEGKMPDSAKARQLKANQLDEIPPGSAVIVVRVRDVSSEQSIGFSFERVGADPMVPAWAADGQVSDFQVSQALIGERPEGKFVAVAVPPGEWRLSSLGFYAVLDLCLGSPSFEVKPGEVIFAGTFDMGGSPFRPDKETIAARQFLKRRPDLADALKLATWRNGSTGKCTGPVIYALEFDGAPFKEGYVDGGARKAAAATP